MQTDEKMYLTAPQKERLRILPDIIRNQAKKVEKMQKAYTKQADKLNCFHKELQYYHSINNQPTQ